MSDDKMSFRHRWILAVGKDSTLSMGARFVGVMAAMQYGKPDAGQEFWPSYTALGDLIGKSARTARRHMTELVDAGWLIRVSGAAIGTSNHYTLTMRSDPTHVKTVVPPRSDLSYEHIHRTDPIEQIQSPRPRLSPPTWTTALCPPR